MDYYCSQFDQPARSRYHSAKCGETEHVCDFLLRLNGYARTAQIQYEKGGADAADNVEHFLLNCGDDDLLDLIYPQRLDDIQRVEKIISYRFLGEEQKKQRDRVKTGHGLSLHKRERRDSRRKDRDDGTVEVNQDVSHDSTSVQAVGPIVGMLEGVVMTDRDGLAGTTIETMTMAD